MSAKNKIDKDYFDKLYDPNVTKRDYDAIISAIGDRTNHIWRIIIKISSRNLGWWAFSNDVELGDGNGSTGGEFDPETDKEFIEVMGDFTTRDEEEYLFNEGFPTRFLWTDDSEWKNEVLKNIEECYAKHALAKEKAKQDREQAELKRKETIKIIKSKLTKEELKYVQFN